MSIHDIRGSVAIIQVVSIFCVESKTKPFVFILVPSFLISGAILYIIITVSLFQSTVQVLIVHMTTTRIPSDKLKYNVMYNICIGYDNIA